eukprot:3940876-Rhodomonas_salina.6
MGVLCDAQYCHTAYDVGGYLGVADSSTTQYRTARRRYDCVRCVSTALHVADTLRQYRAARRALRGFEGVGRAVDVAHAVVRLACTPCADPPLSCTPALRCSPIYTSTTRTGSSNWECHFWDTGTGAYGRSQVPHVRCLPVPGYGIGRGLDVVSDSVVGRARQLLVAPYSTSVQHQYKGLHIAAKRTPVQRSAEFQYNAVRSVSTKRTAAYGAQPRKRGKGYEPTWCSCWFIRFTYPSRSSVADLGTPVPSLSTTRGADLSTACPAVQLASTRYGTGQYQPLVPEKRYWKRLNIARPFLRSDGARFAESPTAPYGCLSTGLAVGGP